MSSEAVRKHIKRFIPLVDFFAEVLGPNSEVVLNDVTDLDHSVVYIKNPTITNRKVGDPASNFVLKIMKDGIDADTNFIANYSGKSKSTPDLRSSTYFIRYRNKIVGMLCINTDQAPLEALVKQMDTFKKLFEVQTTPISEISTTNKENKTVTRPNKNIKVITENFNSSVSSIAKSAVEKKERELNVSVDFFQQDQKIAVIKELYEDGYFLLKDSIRVIASALKCSSPTIYRYLNKVKNMNHQQNTFK